MSQQALRCLALAVKSDELGDLANYDGAIFLFINHSHRLVSLT
jgi:hypothetical protein